MRRRAVSAVLAAALVAAALSLPACARRPQVRPDVAELSEAKALADEQRYDAAMRAYMKLAERTQVGGRTFDLAMAGVASSFTSRIATMSVTGQVDEIAAFYREYTRRLHPPALATYTSALLASAAEQQVTWAEAFSRDRSRWLREIGARGRADEREVGIGNKGWQDVQLMTPDQARRISSAVPNLDQPASMAELYRLVVELAEANRTYVILARELDGGAEPTQEQVDAAIKANDVATRDVQRAKALLGQQR